MSEPPESVVPSEFGEAEIARLVAAFYTKVREDELIGPMYPSDDWKGAELSLIHISSPRDKRQARMPSSA